MAEQKKPRSTMSVREMRQLLGLKKTDSYWLVHKNYFETIIVAGKMRIVLDSFEDWYANQDHYHKVTGEIPGQKLILTSYSIQNIADMLGICHDSALELVKRIGLARWKDKLYFRVSRKEFDEWYASQHRHRNETDRKRDEAAEAASITIPEMGRELGLDRREAYKLAYHLTEELEVIRVGGRPRITLKSYEKWYNGQKEYLKISGEKPSIMMVPLVISREKTTFGYKEASEILQISEYEVYNLIATGELQRIVIAKRNRISRDSMQDYADRHHLLMINMEG